jgi:hypothetical protein
VFGAQLSIAMTLNHFIAFNAFFWGKKHTHVFFLSFFTAIIKATTDDVS